MKRSTIIIIAAAAVCVIAACTLVLTGVIRLPWKKQADTPDQAKLYVEYTNNYMLISEDDVVLSSSLEVPEGIPKVSGISFSSIVPGEKLKPEDENAYDYANRIVDALVRNVLSVDEIYISSDLKATLYVNQVKILLGADDHTDDKLKELRDFYDDVKDLSGVLDMQELSHNNIGYSFKQN